MGNSGLKTGHSAALSLFFADSNMVSFFKSSRQRLFQDKAKFTNIPTPKINSEGLQSLRDLVAVAFPNQDIFTLFPPSLVKALQAQLASDAPNFPLSPDELAYFQLAIILMRLASDYIDAWELLELHKEGFTKVTPRVLSFNPITNEISWDAVREHMEQVLEESFPQRYREMAITKSEHYRDSKLANEALTIAMTLFDQKFQAVATSDGLAFEHECEDLLHDAEYVVQRTPLSGDFGVDLLARKNGLTYAIQCKCYGIPVGVSAVQEAAAGRSHYMADCAVVVADSGFTNQARRLAESNAVLLIGKIQLRDLQDLARPLL
jgi:Restriction endonuclease